MKCPKCQFENPDGIKFCGDCGTKLDILCPHCNYSNPPQFKFCGECGQKLSIPSDPTPKDLSFDEKLEKIQRYLPKGLTEKILSQRDKIEGERNQVTVMFCDMEGFTVISERIGAEEAYSIMDQIYEILIHKVHDYEGTINEMTGDGIVALFGSPIALEDAPQRAIRSALAIHREMAKFSEKVGDKSRILPILMRVGIHTGPVVVGTLGNDLRVEFKAVGDTVNLASSMEEIAEPGTTYVTEDTFTITEGLFRFEGLGDRKIKGKEKPIKIYRVLAPSTSRTRFDVSSERGLTPFVGRERELELLLDGLERAKTGRGQAFSIVAEAGLGKSRLLYEFRKAITNENVTFLEGKCLSYSRNVPYHPVIDILKSSFRIRESDGDIDIKVKIKKGLKIIGADEASTLPYLLELLSVKDSGIDEISMSPEARKDRIIEALNRNVLKGSEIRPVVMAIEDLHWIDKSSEDRFKSLLINISGARVFLLFTYRPEFVHTWGGRSYHSQVNLNRLSNRESLMMISHLLGAEGVDSDLENMILDKTEGVPFFVEEFIRSLKDLKVIEKKDNTYYLTKKSQTLKIPSRIQDVIMARVDSLSEGVKEVLQIGSVIGREFNYDLLKQVLELPEENLLTHLSTLKDFELLYERGIYPQSTYIFKHSLTQESVYQSLLMSTRQKYHQLIAGTVEQHFSDIIETQPEILGHHFTEAGIAEKAIVYWKRAGEISVRRSANIEAMAHFSKGLNLLEVLPENNERIRHELDLRIAMGAPLIAIKGGGSKDVERNYSQARELCEKVEDNQRLFPVLRGLIQFHLMAGNLRTGLELSKQFLRFAQKHGDQTHILAAHRSIGGSLFWLGELTDAGFHIEKAIDLYDPELHHSQAFIYSFDQGAMAMAYTTLILWLLGFPDKALKQCQKSVDLAHRLHHSYTLVHVLFYAAWFYNLNRDFNKTHEVTEEVICLATEEKFPVFIGVGSIVKCWALGMQTKDNKLIPHICESIDHLQRIGFKQFRTYALGLLSEVYSIVGQAEIGLKALKEAQVFMNKTDERFWEAEIYRLKGELLLSQLMGNQSEAERCFDQALEVARHQQAKSLELRAAMSLSRLWQGQEKKDEARNLLSDIYSWFTEGFDTVDLKEAKALLDELS